ncbi:MAG: T9SS type A sorting domain-containing protein [Bacteroidales bacterium]|nr:T9SS type A sorting domain-containing protein [Bacteroidales bacterium]
MKKTFTLIITVFVVVSLMGQSMKKVEHTSAALQQKSTKKVMELFSPKGLDKDFKKHPEFTKNAIENRSIKELKHVLDSMDGLFEGTVYYKERYTYNAQGNCVLIEDFGLNESNLMEPNARSAYSFDANGNMTTYTYIYWDEDLNDWLNFYKMEYSYSNGLLTNGDMFIWDEELNAWDLMIKEEFTYDDEDRLTTIVSLVDNNGIWEKEYKEEVTYNTAGYAYLWMDYDWNNNTSLWIPYSKDEDFFDVNGDVEMNLWSEWEEMMSLWQDLYKDEYTYDANHQMITDIYSEFDEMTMQWNLWFKDEYSYDEYGNDFLYISSDWIGSDWVLWSKEELTFDYSIANDVVVYPNEYDYGFSHMLTEVNDYIWEDSWTEDQQYIMYYSEKDVSGIADISNSNIQVYPNPSTGIFNIELSGFGQEFSISVLDFAGSVLEQEEVSNAINFKKSFDLSDYSKGVYLLKIDNGAYHDYQKIVIQ